MAKTERPKYTAEQERELRANPINEFTCSCKDAKPMKHKDFMDHLKETHKIDTSDKSQLAGNRKMLMHMDGKEWYSSSYQWTLETGLKFTQYCENIRAPDDIMRHMY